MHSAKYSGAIDGPLALLGRSLARASRKLRVHQLAVLLLTLVRRYVGDYVRLYLYQHYHREWPEGTFLPPPGAFEERFVATNAEADALVHDHEDFRAITRRARRGLDSGAVAFCVYDGSHLAHIAWLATSAEGRNALDRLGFEVRFGAGEGWTGAAYTVPAYRGRGLLTYSCYRRFEYLLQHGCRTSRGAVAVRNKVSHHATMRFEPHIYAIGTHWSIAGHRGWSERPVI
jgi:hypothetical protein